MPPRIGYLLPTREQIMEGRPDAAPLLDLAARAEALGYDSVWVGDSVLARPRHDPLTLLAGVAGRVPRVALGTAVLLPALRNPVLLAHQVATLDQVSEGRFILGVGIARDVPNIRAEFAACGVPFEKRVGRMMEGLRLCRALWSGEAVDWDGRWPVSARCLGAGAASARRSADLDRRQHAGEPGACGKVVRRLVPQRAGRIGVRRSVARSAGDRPCGRSRSGAAVGSDVPDAHRSMTMRTARRRGWTRSWKGYYGAPAAVLRRRQAVYSGPAEGLAAWLDGYAKAGATDLVLRFAGEHERHLEAVAKNSRLAGMVAQWPTGSRAACLLPGLDGALATERSGQRLKRFAEQPALAELYPQARR